MEVYSTSSRKVCLVAVLGTSNFILEIFNISLPFSKVSWNYLTSFDRIALNCSTTVDTISYDLRFQL